MNKLNFDNKIRQQVMSLPAMVDDQLKGCFSNLDTLLTNEEISAIDSIILTGCGDSYAAALAFEPAVKKYGGCRARAMRAIDFTRFCSTSEVGDPSKTLVIGISTGGGTARVAEVLTKANQIGTVSLLITNNGESPLRFHRQTYARHRHPRFYQRLSGAAFLFRLIDGNYRRLRLLGTEKGNSSRHCALRLKRSHRRLCERVHTRP